MKRTLFIAVMLAVCSMLAQTAAARTIEVVSNSKSGIANATLTATLEDGTVLGFSPSNEVYLYFTGAISQNSELVLPDTILYKSKRCMIAIGYYSGWTPSWSAIDFSKAQTVTDLTLHSNVETIYRLPSCVSTLHLKRSPCTVHSGLNSYKALSYLSRLFVPEEYLSSYLANSNWYPYVLINAEGAEPLTVHVDLEKVGELAQKVLEQTDNWNKVNILEVTGAMNDADLNVIQRMRQLTQLDLSQSKIQKIPDKFSGKSDTTSTTISFGALENVRLPKLNTIGEYAFSGCYRLKNISMPKVSTISKGAFAGIAAQRIDLPEGLQTIGESAFHRSKLEELTLPSTVTSIGTLCFNGCYNLKNISISSSMTSIPSYAFRYSGLTDINLSGIKTISNNAFEKCTKLKEVKFAEGLNEIGSNAFIQCNSLTEIDLPSTLIWIDYNAFSSCSKINNVISRAVVPPTHSGRTCAFTNDKTDVRLYVPAMSIDAYRQDSGWKEFYTILPLEDKTSTLFMYDVTSINDPSEFTDDCWIALTMATLNRNGVSGTYRGVLEYNGAETFSIGQFIQEHDLGSCTSAYPYYYNAVHTALIANGPMRADKVKTGFYTKEAKYWYFITVPHDVAVSDISSDIADVQVAIRRYSGENRASQSGSTWLDLTPDSIMHAHQGYILKCNKDNAFFSFPAINNVNKNKVFEKGNVVMPLEEHLGEFAHNRSWNLIGNPYPCFYDTRRMDFTAPITVWNRYNSRYDAYSPVDDSYIFRPGQAFFVQRPVDKESITFDKAGRQINAAVQALPAQTRQKTVNAAERKVFNVTLTDGDDSDRCRFVVNAGASCDYELDKDASKFLSADNTSALIYTIENGVKYAINERPQSDGIVSLGYYAPADGTLTIGLSTECTEPAILIDNETGAEIAMPGEYTFSTASGYNDRRFAISFGAVSAIESVSADSFAAGEYTVHTADGRYVGRYPADAVSSLSSGIYIISNNGISRKIYIK